MTRVIPASHHDHFRASRIVIAMAAMALLGLLAALPARLEAQCTLSGSPVSFEPNQPGVSRGGTPYLGGGFSSNLALYQNGGSGPYRLLMQESYGYSVLDLSDPVNPRALYYHDVRFPVGGPNSVPHHGDGQSDIQTIAVSPDGQRVALSTVGPAAPFNTVVGSPNGASGFTLWGDFSGQGANGTVIQHIGSRYIAYDMLPNFATASDITTLPTSSLAELNMASEATSWPGGYLASIAGNYLLYQDGGAVQVIDASNPGPAGRITASYPRTTITSADFGGRTIAFYSAAVDPADATKLWVLVELSAQAGENSPSYGLLTVSGSLAKVSAGPIWRVPSQANDVWWSNPGPSSALIASNGSLFVLMWAQRALPSLLFELYSTTVAAWGAVNSSARPGVLDIPTAFYSNFSPGQPMRGFSAGNSIYAYLPTGSSAYVIPMSCVSQNAPAVASMTVANQAGAPLNNGDTVFLGDQITITPSVNPSTAGQPLTGFGWNFDFDFHAGAASDDFCLGTSCTPPRLKAPDNAAFGSGNQPHPPDLITVVGPCDPQVGGTSPGSGTGCWTSVTTNNAFGGPDFAAAPAAGSTKPLTFAFEANNFLGSAGPSLFTLNWKVPAAKLQSTQILSGQPLVSGSDGHPTATGFKWYFGATPTTLAPAAGCTSPTCVPTLDTKGTYSYWLTASYANGYMTPDYAGTAAMGTYTVTDFAPAFTVNGSTNGPITAITNQTLSVVNSSKLGAGVAASGGYFYSLCQIPCTDSFVLWGTMGDPTSGAPSTSATIPVPAAAGSYALKIQMHYTGGNANWPDPAGAAFFPLNVLDVIPLVVNVSVTPPTAPAGQLVTFSCNATGGLAPYHYEWRSPISFIVGSQQTYQTTSPVASNVQALCTVTDSQAIPATSSASAFATFTGNSVPVSVNVSASPNPAIVGSTVYFTCSASGGNGGPFNYAWSGNAVSGAGPNVSQTFTSAGNYNATCTATDTAGGGSSQNSVTVRVGTSGGNLSVIVSVNPNPGTVNQPVTFSCNVSGGTAPYTYQWRSPLAFLVGSLQTYQTTPAVAGNIQAWCYVSDSAGGSSSNTATVTIVDAAPPAAPCADVDFRIVDDATHLPIPISGNFLGQYFSVQTGQRLQFIASGRTQASWTSVAWSFGPDGDFGSGNPSFVYAYPASGTFTATATVDGNSGCTKSYRFIVAGPSGLFTARYADNSKFSSTQVESGKDVSFLATDTADSYSYAWNFGDGKTATGKNPTHAFTVNGSTNVTFTTTLTVTIGSQNWPTSQTFTVIPPPEPPKWFIAGLANTQGAVLGTVWQSDLTILNPHPTLSGTYSLAFLDGSKTPVAPKDLVWKTITLPAQQSTSWSNVIDTFFGKSLGSYGAVIVRGDVAPVAPTITSRTYNNGDPGKGTFGLSVPVAQATSGVSQQSSAAQQLLIGLRDDASAETNTGAYTNIGLVNLISTDWSHAHLTFFDAAGANLGVLQVDVPPYGFAQRNKPLTSGGWLGKPPLALYRVQVTVDPGGAVYPYATVIDQASTDPIVVTVSDPPAATYRMPGIVRLTGANGERWRSRFTIANPSVTKRTVTVSYSYVPCDGNDCGGVQTTRGDIPLAAGQSFSADDFVAYWLEKVGKVTVSDTRGYGSSLLDVSPKVGDANQDPLVVLGETYNDTPNGHIGLQIPGYTPLDGASGTGAYKRLALTGLASTTAYRTNLALFVVAGAPGKWVNVHVYSPQGTKLRDVPVPVDGFSPVNNETLFGGLPGDLSRLSIIVDNIDDGVTVGGYATIIDNLSGDATFVKAQPVP